MYKWKYWETPTDISFLNIEENEPDLVDKDGRSIRDEYFQGWQSVYQYVYNVLSGKRVAGKFEIAACERFVHDLQREDLYLDKDEIDFMYVVANALVHPQGKLMGQPILLMRWLGFILANMYGWVYSDKARSTLVGENRYQESFVAVGRGNAKTVLGAVAMIYSMLVTKNGNPLGTCSATESKQARIAFDYIKDMTRMAKSKSLRKKFKPLAHEIRLNSGGRIFATSGNADGLDGLRITFGLCDEIHAHPNSRIIDVISTGMGSSENPMLLMITTAGEDTQSYGRIKFAQSEEHLINLIPHDRHFSVIYSLDETDYDNWGDERLWEKANPALHHAVKMENLRTKYITATTSESERANFMTKHLNIWVDFDKDGFVSGEELTQCKDRDLDINNYKGRECYLGLDLASKSDLSSLVYIFPEDNGGVSVFQKSYLPMDAAQKSKVSVKDRYFAAQKDNELSLTLDEVTDFDEIKRDIIAAHELYDVQAASIDQAAGGARFASELEAEYGIELVAVQQGFGLSESACLLQRLIKSKKFKYNSKLLEWCFTNAMVKEGMKGDIAVIKDKDDSTKKIDICIATLIGLSQTILREARPDYSNFTLRMV